MLPILLLGRQRYNCSLPPQSRTPSWHRGHWNKQRATQAFSESDALHFYRNNQRSPPPACPQQVPRLPRGLSVTDRTHWAVQSVTDPEILFAVSEPAQHHLKVPEPTPYCLKAPAPAPRYSRVTEPAPLCLRAPVPLSWP
ncbi:hypothetical protein AMECASPLE_039259 [Ameca splendens]|uniref:Uncharacterized protein n=1 Tax=Ameca splendens TaxID=208324 RepID=A0ABV0XXG3_9TELE